MPRTLPHTNQIIKLNGERITRTYTSEVVNHIELGKNKSSAAVAIEFDLTFYGIDQEGLLNYRMEVKKRFLLNEKFSIVRKVDKAQKIALKVASVNDILELKVDKSFKLNKVNNTKEIRQKWKEVKIDLLEEYPDLLKMTSDFDWQLQEDNIQRVFLEDNFYQFFFTNIFYQEFEDKKLTQQAKIAANALGNINIPILEKKKISKQDIGFTKVTITSEAEMDINHKKFPLAKLNGFLGKLPTSPGEKHTLDFEYKGTYKVKPQFGLVTKGTLNYSFEVKDLYKKTTTITFNLEKDE
ncbi:hypothetical protein SAMN04487910_0055 [Aquimarina amphilecti]|uniref:Uncharacterized protein n=1 Tax=Aquimarina amphilecti TaxID=1038014 RepID=A0A1H7FEP4_AQUAM|nr:hypothetical protein [Aquimarina amphilecti]SEK24224.1 hypothetical protein SAMN04487910_0055 [Aquimarina amphilecti]